MEIILIIGLGAFTIYILYRAAKSLDEDRNG